MSQFKNHLVFSKEMPGFDFSAVVIYDGFSRARVSKLQPVDRPISPLSIYLFIYKALLEHSCAHLLHIIHGWVFFSFFIVVVTRSE